MRDGLKVGDEAELVWRVSAEHAIHLGYPPAEFDSQLWSERDGVSPVSAAVFSTPFMILLMERAARKVIEPFLDPGEASVGATVNIEHLAGTPIGAEVRGTAKITAVQGRSIMFDVHAYDRHELIGRGSHRRAVVPVQKIARRMATKAGRSASDETTLTWMDGVAGLPPASESWQLPAEPDMNAQTPATLPDCKTLSVELAGRLAIVTLNRPQKKNAVNVAMTEDWERLNTFFSRRPDIRVVIVTGAGNSFCAGDDISEVGTLSIDEARELSYRQARVYLAWEQLPQVFIAAVRGTALGGGCVVACACDLRIASYDASFGMPEVLLGWPPGYGIAQLTALIGKSRAMEWCLAGRPVAARKALEYGLVHQLAPAGTLLTEAKNYADRLMSLPAAALRETKRLVHLDEGLQPKTAFLADTAAYIRCLQMPEAAEGIAAFNEKRPPRFNADKK